MKKISLIFSLFVTTSIFAQKSADQEIPYFPMDDETHLVSYSEVIQVPGIMKDSLYKIAIEWTKEFYKSPSEAIKSQSLEDGVIEIKHQFQVSRKDHGQDVKAGTINYYLTLQFRDGRFKYTVTKINLASTSYFGIEKWINEPQYQKDENVPGYLQQIDKFMQNLTESIETDVQPKAPKKEEEW